MHAPLTVYNIFGFRFLPDFTILSGQALRWHLSY